MAICESIIFWTGIVLMAGFSVFMMWFVFHLMDAVHQHDKGDF